MPKVTHTPQGKALLKQFVFAICGCKENWQAKQIISQIVESIREQVNGLNITVNTYKNNVQLSGFVKTLQEKQKAAEIAGGVEGVGSVTNFLEVKNL